MPLLQLINIYHTQDTSSSKKNFTTKLQEESIPVTVYPHNLPDNSILYGFKIYCVKYHV